MECALLACTYAWCTWKSVGRDKIFRATCIASVAVGALGCFGESGQPFSVTCLILGSRRVGRFPHWSSCSGCWLAVETWLGVCCWLILPAKFLLKAKYIAYTLQVAGFFYLQGTILFGNRSHLIQSIANGIIKICLISPLDRWGDNSLFFETVLCLLKIILPVLHKCHIAARPY